MVGLVHSVKKTRADWITVEAAHEGIIEPELFQAAQAELKAAASVSDADTSPVLERYRQYADLDTLTPATAKELVQRVVVYPDSRLEVQLNCRDELEALLTKNHSACCDLLQLHRRFRCAGSPENPGDRYYHGNKKRRSTQLRPGTGCCMNFSGNKKAECPLQDTQIL